MSKPTDSQNFRRLSFSVPAGFNVDRAGGILKNLALISGEREAKGHGLYVDAETIKTAHACALARGQLKGAMRHLSWDEYFNKGGDRVLDFPGWFAGFSIKGADLVAEKFEFYETFRTDPATAPAFNRIMEVADKTPNLIGLSIEAWGYAVFVAKDGKEYGTKPDGVELLYDGVPALRITDLFFAAFVDEPAATDGLFARFSALFGAKQKMSLSAAAELDASLSLWAEKHAGYIPAPSEGPTAEPNLSTMKIIETIKAEFGANAAKFSQAMTLLGNKPDITIEALRAEMVSADLSALNGQVTTLTTELGTANGKVTALSTERDSWKSKYETLKASGKNGGELPLGAPSAGAGAVTVNPYLKASFNRTSQALLSKSNPELAATFKAAAAAENN